MAGTNSRTFRLTEGVTIPMLGEAIVGYLRSEKRMVAEGAPAPEGYFVQAKSDDDGWKKLSGMTKAIQVQIIGAGEMVTVNIGQGKWSDKVGAGVVGAFLFAPLAVTAVVGAVGQNKLPDEILQFCERYLMSGGNSVRVSATPLSGGKVSCKQCGHPNDQGMRFCSNCGAQLGKSCPQCNAPIDENARFCSNCGADVNPVSKCTSCGTELPPGAKFCSACGAQQQ